MTKTKEKATTGLSILPHIFKKVKLLQQIQAKE
jgi:hypothetical protein